MSLRVDLEGNSSGFQQMLNSAKQNAKAFANEVGADVSHSWGGIGRNLAAGIGGMFGLDALRSHLEGIVQRSNEITEMAEQFDMTTGSVQKWEKAVARAGVTFTTFTRAIETLRQKRDEAKSNDEGMKPFAALGISEDIVRGGTSDEALLRAILASGGDRTDIMKLLGPRGAKLGAALPYLGGASPAFSPSDLQAIHGAEQQYKDAKSDLDRLSVAVGPGRAMIFWDQVFKKNWKGAWQSIVGVGRSYLNAIFGDPSKIAGTPAATEPEPVTTEDPELTLRHKLKEEQVEKSIADEQLRQAKFTREMHQSQLGIMTISERRKTIETDMAAIAEQIQAIDNANPALRESLKGQKEALLLEYQRLAVEGREKPMTFSPDSLAHVGLFTRASLAFNPVLETQNQTKIGLLKEIRDNTRPSQNVDPLAP